MLKMFLNGWLAKESFGISCDSPEVDFFVRMTDCLDILSMKIVDFLILRALISNASNILTVGEIVNYNFCNQMHICPSLNCGTVNVHIMIDFS